MSSDMKEEMMSELVVEQLQKKILNFGKVLGWPKGHKAKGGK